MIFSAILIASTVAYAALYFAMIPKLVQEMPIQFALHKPHAHGPLPEHRNGHLNEHIHNTEHPHDWSFDAHGFIHQPALIAHVEIESALTEYQRR